MKKLTNILNILLKELSKFTTILNDEYNLIISINYIDKLKSNIDIINNKYKQLNKLTYLNYLRCKQENVIKLKAPYINYKFLSFIWQNIVKEIVKINYYNSINTINLKKTININFINLKIN
ncbi:MAG: hypothetical protein N4P94_01460 [Candidatus Lightella neohaematopini]|nr:hypothetical protein [Candidatus Lightella neohaematopini]